MNNEKLEIINIINRLKDPKLLVIGDFAIDEMVYGKTARISREAPVLILKHSETKLFLELHQMPLTIFLLLMVEK